MDDRSKNKDQLINELEQMRQRVAVLERAETENRRIQEDMKKQNDELQYILDSVPAFIFYKDREGRLIRGNAAVARSAEMPKEGWVGKTVFDLLPGLAESYYEDDMEVMTSGKPKKNIVEPFDTPKGLRWLRTTKIPAKDPEGNVTGLIGFSVDITDRMQAEEALRESEEKLRAIFNSTSDGIVVVDLEGKVTEVNSAALRMSGYSREGVIGRNAFELIAERDRDKALEVMVNATKEGRAVERTEYTLVTADGREFLAELVTAMLYDNLDNAIGFIATIRDVTERRRAEMELHSYRDRLEKMVEERTADLTVANRQLKQEIANRERVERALRDSEERLRTTFESMAEGVLIVDLQGNIAEVNRTALNMAKCRKKELIGRSIFEFIAPEERTQSMSELGAVLAAGVNRADLEYTFVDAEGKRIDAEFSATLLRDSGGNPAGIIGIARDLTERKRMEMALRESEEKLRIMFESIGDAITLTDLEGRISDLNKAAVKTFGLNSKEEAMGQVSFEYIAKKSFDRAMRDMSGLFEKGVVGPIEYTFHTADGREFEAESSNAVLKDASGKPIGFVSINRDITERKRMQDALRESEEKLRIVFDSITDGIAVTDLQINVVQANEAVTRMAGYSTKDEVIGKNALEWIAPEDLSKAMEPMNEALKGRPIERGEFRIRNVQGGEFLGDVGISPLRDSSGNMSGFVTVIRDVTERRRAEEALRQSEEKYRSLVDHMQEGYLIVRGEHIKYANERCAEFLGIPVDKIIGKSIWEFVVPVDMEKAKQTEEVFTRGGVAPLQEFSYYREDGRMVPLEANLKAVSYEGKPALAVVLRDITERKQMEREIRESEEKLRTMFQTMRDGVVLIDIDGKIVDVNEAILRIGRHESREKLIGRICFDLIVDKDRDRLSKAVSASLAGGEATGMWEAKFTRGDGTEFDAEMTAAMLRDSTGQPSGFIGVIRDITDRKRMEKVVRDSEEKLRGIFASVGDGIVVTDMEGKIIEANETAIRYAGFKDNREAIIGHNALDFIAVGDRDSAAKSMMRAFERGRGVVMEFRMVGGEEGEFDGEAAATLMRDNLGNPTGLVAVIRDVSARKRMQEKLRESETKLRFMFSSMIDAVVVVDLEGKLTELNDAGLRMTGYSSREEVIGKNAFDFIAEEDRARAVGDLARSLETAPGFMVQYKFVDKDGKGYDVEAAGSMLFDDDGNVTGFINVVRDITERKRMQEELRQSEEKLRAMFDSIGDAVTITDLKGAILDENQAAVRIAGLTSKDELIGRNGFELIAEKDRAKAIKDMLSTFKHKDTLTMEYTLLRNDGSQWEGEASLALMRDSSGKPMGVVAVTKDITERKRMQEELKQSEEKLRNTFESAYEGIMVTDPVGNIIEANDVVLNLHGYKSKEELFKINSIKLVSKKDRARLAQDSFNAIKEGRSFKGEYLLLKADGTEFEAECRMSVMYDSAGKPIGLVGVSYDITDRKRAEEALRESEEKLRTMFEAIEDGITVTDLKGNIVQHNEAARQMLGYGRRDKFIGRKGFGFIAKKDRTRAEQYMKGVVEKERGGTIEYSLLAKDGTEIDTEVHAALIRDSSGNPISIVGVARDVTERKRMQEALRESEEKLRFMFDSIADGMIMVDLSGNIQEVNAAAARMAGYSNKEEMIGRSAFDFVAERDRDRALAENMKNIAGGRGSTVVYTAVDRNGREITVEAMGAMLRDAAGNPIGFITVIRDITERMRMQEALRESEEKLRFMFNSIADGVVSVDLQGNIRDVNPAFVRMTGYGSKEDMLGRSALDLVGGRDRAKALEQFTKYDAGVEQVGGLEYAVKGKSGREFDAEVSAGQLRDREGKPLGFIVAVRDVSERIRMQEAVRESEEKLRTILDTSPDFIMSLDRDGKLLFINHTVPEMTVEQAIGTSAYDYILPEAREDYQKTVGRIFTTGEAAAIETSGLGPGGRTSYYETRFAPVLHEGKVVSITLISTDITERKVAGEALRESEEKLRFMFESMGDAIVVINVEGKITEVNEKLIAMSGYESREEVLGRNAFEFVTERDRTKAMEDFTRNMERQISATIEYTAVDRYGREFDVEANGAMLKDAAGKPVGFIIALRDVSERKRMQEELRKSEERLRFMFESMGDAIVVIDVEGKIVEVNERLIAMAGYESREEVLGEMPLSSLLRGFAQGQWEISRSMGRQVSATVEYVAADRHGKEFDVEANGAMLRDAAGKPVGFIIALRDVSERKLMEQKLRDSEEMGRGMLESAATGIYLVQNGKFEYVSPMFADISGYTNDELIGTQALGYVHPDDREMVREKAVESLKGKGSLPYEFRFVRKDGTIVWILEKVASIQHKGKRATIASFMDITEHRRADQALRESQEKLRSFMDSATDYFTIWDSKLNLVDLNEAALRYPLVDFTGKIQRENVIGKNILRLEPTIRETDRYDRYMEVIRTGKPFFAEDIIPHTKLGDIHMAISAFKVGEGLGIITADVTERRRAEEELRKSKIALEKRTNQLLALQKVTASIQSTLSLSDVLQQVAEGVVENLGYDQSMVLVVDEKADVYRGRAFFSKDRPKYREGVESIMEQALTDIKFPRKRGYSMGLDESMNGKVVITPNFSALSVPPLDKQQANAIQKLLGANTIVSMPLFAMERHVGGILAFTARDDIAEPDIEPLRLLADQAGVAIVNANIYEGAAEMAQRLAVTGTLSRILGSSLDIREVYKAFVEEIHNVIDFERASIALVEGDRLRFLAVSPDVEPGGGTMMPVAGSPTEWVIQQKRTNIEHDIAVEGQFSIDSVYAEEGMRSAIRVPLISKGEAFGSFDLVSRNPNAYGEREQGILEQVAGSVAAAIENSRLFIRIKEHEAELVKAYEELKKAQEYMVQAERLRALGELAGGVAHDFNNVLAIILGRAQLALEDVEDAKLKKDLQIIEQTALDAATTVRRLQDFARVRVDRGFETVDLNEVVEGALQMVESRRMELKETRGVIIDVDADLGEVPSVQGEAAELREALVNIIFNAIDAMPKGGSLTVKSRQDKEGVLLSIRDTGEGIPDDVKGKIFDPFFTTRPQKGSGLGLSVTYGIITRHGGRIEFESEVGKGTTFYIWLPMAIGVKAAKRPEQKAAGVKSAEVLLVDDDPEVSEVLQRMLQQMGHRVTGVNSGEEAVNAFEAGHYDLVVTDLGMPDMSGREVAAAVKDIKPGTPVLLITGWGVQLDPSELPEIDGIVAKPFSKEVLKEQLAKLLPAEDGSSKEKPRKKKGPH